jgi:cytochrome c oxidase subunit III
MLTPTAPSLAMPTDHPESTTAPVVDSALDAVPVASHFDSAKQQHDSVMLGMWLFLATEIMFFGGAFATYTIYRMYFGEAFHLASRTLDAFVGTINTFVLLTSSLTMVLAVDASEKGRRGATIAFVLATIVLGGIFLGVKAGEYQHKFHEHHAPMLGLKFDWHPDAVSEEVATATAGGAAIFFSLYFGMTGLHALHMVIGMALLAIFVVRCYRAPDVRSRSVGLELMGLYWHFVDIVWIFLFPLLYLIDRT